MNYYREYGVSDDVFAQSEKVLYELRDLFQKLEEETERKHLRVLTALQKAQVREAALSGSTGYGYDDAGREALEKAFAEYFRTEAALVRIQFSSGTHVLATCLRGLLRPGDEFVVASSEVYDTLQATLGTDKAYADEDLGSLRDFGIRHTIVNLRDDGSFHWEKIREAINEKTKLVYVQKSLGYSERNTLLNKDIGDLTGQIKALRSDITVMVDNCYGEMVEMEEPTAYGVDICAGSLIKNPGAGIANSGAYVCGKKEAVKKVAAAMTAPGVGGEIGPSLGHTRDMMRGFYFSPMVVKEALKGAIHAAALLESYGYKVKPLAREARGDIVQRIVLGEPEKLIAFCEEVQFASPVDASFAPVPAPMPGYDCDIIMASGSFVQGSSIELSCDGPLRPPYNAFLQGGLHFAGSRLAVMRAVDRLLK